MKKVEEVRKDLEEVRKDLEEVRKDLEELKKNKNNFEPTPKTWIPNESEAFWVADIELNPVVYTNIKQFKSRNNRILKYNRIFKTLEECQLYCDIQKAFRDTSREFKYTSDNYYLWYDHTAKKIRNDCLYSVQHKDIYFDSEKTIQNLIDKFGEENVKRYYLGVY